MPLMKFYFYLSKQNMYICEFYGSSNYYILLDDAYYFK